MSEEKKYWWSDIMNYIPLAYIILICIGYTQQSIYYEHFQINIEEYLNFEEYLLFFLPLGGAISIGFLIISAFISGLIVAISVLFTRKKSNKIRKEKLASNFRFIRLLIKTRKIRGILSFLTLAFLGITPFVLIIYDQISNVNLSPYIIFYSILWSFIIIVLYIYAATKDDFTNTNNPKKHLLIYSFIIIFSATLTYSFRTHNAEIILKGKSKKKIEFSIGQMNIETNDSIAFIGQTKNYIFLRNLNTNMNYIYLKDKINEIRITE
ncbi:hypothetical protein I2486_09325 [Cellulophaga sp. E16_2]|uniref:hypothetical protein n=1 Tax=Cellulophaga sp. E16_2 TaxID=2789297 RepID=UPI001A931203|nr:hypothetical protein [Cellulophaga sp. E16_2]MBO0591607.1 hypothetical protein [Cellulophaga sp. E16_2]